MRSESTISCYVTAVAERAGVQYQRLPGDDLAAIISRLSDDDVVPDEIEDLIVALRRAEVIGGPEMVDLLSQYLNEKMSVRGESNGHGNSESRRGLCG